MDLEEIKKEYNELTGKIAKAENLLVKPKEKCVVLRNIIRENCPDHCPSAYVKEHNFDGTYYDKARTDYYLKCDVCGKFKQIDSKTHGWYG